jgi:uncharacterized protein YbaA (DUF1428 family)
MPAAIIPCRSAISSNDYHYAAEDSESEPHVVPFPDKMELKPGETVVFSWVVFKSRAQRDRVDKKVME